MKNLKTIRRETGLTQTDMARKINVSQQCYSDYENGKTNPDLQTLALIADILHVSIDYLVGRTDDFGAEIPAPAAMLSDREQTVLNMFRKMTVAQQNRYIGFGEGMLGISGSSNLA